MRFAFGVAGFVIVLVLIERYDEEHNASLFWPYVIIVWLGYALANRDNLRSAVSQLHSITAAPALSRPATSGKAAPAYPNTYTPGAGGQPG